MLNEEDGLEEEALNEKGQATLSAPTISELDGGFGIGLKLIDKLCAKLKWGYAHERITARGSNDEQGGVSRMTRGYRVVLTVR